MCIIFNCYSIKHGIFSLIIHIIYPICELTILKEVSWESYQCGSISRFILFEFCLKGDINYMLMDEIVKVCDKFIVLFITQLQQSCCFYNLADLFWLLTKFPMRAKSKLFEDITDEWTLNTLQLCQHGLTDLTSHLLSSFFTKVF